MDATDLRGKRERLSSLEFGGSMCRRCQPHEFVHPSGRSTFGNAVNVLNDENVNKPNIIPNLDTLVSPAYRSEFTR